MSHDAEMDAAMARIGVLRFRLDEKEAENARLKAQVERLEKTEESLHNTLNQYALDDMRLQAKVERLERAGDLMLKYACANVTYPCYATMAKDWLSAKEGKQS